MILILGLKGRVKSALSLSPCSVQFRAEPVTYKWSESDYGLNPEVAYPDSG